MQSSTSNCTVLLLAMIFTQLVNGVTQKCEANRQVVIMFWLKIKTRAAIDLSSTCTGTYLLYTHSPSSLSLLNFDTQLFQSRTQASYENTSCRVKVSQVKTGLIIASSYQHCPLTSRTASTVINCFIH